MDCPVCRPHRPCLSSRLSYQRRRPRRLVSHPAPDCGMPRLRALHDCLQCAAVRVGRTPEAYSESVTLSMAVTPRTGARHPVPRSRRHPFVDGWDGPRAQPWRVSSRRHLAAGGEWGERDAGHGRSLCEPGDWGGMLHLEFGPSNIHRRGTPLALAENGRRQQLRSNSRVLGDWHRGSPGSPL